MNKLGNILSKNAILPILFLGICVLGILWLMRNLPHSNESTKSNYGMMNRSDNLKSANIIHSEASNTNNSITDSVRHTNDIVNSDNITLSQKVCNLLDARKFDDAIKLAEKEVDISNEVRLYSEIGKKWAEVDPISSFTWATMLETAAEKSSAIKAVVGVVAVSNSGLCLRLVDGIEKGKFKDAAIMAMAPIMADGNRDELIARVGDLTNSGSINSVARLIAGLLISKGDFETLDEVADALPHGEFRDSMVSQTVFALAEKDPKQALIRFNVVMSAGNLSNPFGIMAVTALAQGYSKLDPAQGVAAGEAIQNIELKNKFLDELGGNLGENHPAEAKKWLLNSIADRDYESNKNIADGIIAGLVINGNDEAFRFIDSIPDIESRENAKLVAIISLADDDPKSAAKYFATMGNHNKPENSKAVGEIAFKWLNRDPLAASEWIGGLDQGVGKDAAIEKLITNIIGRDKDLHMADLWMNQVSDPKLKYTLLSKIKMNK